MPSASELGPGRTHSGASVHFGLGPARAVAARTFRDARVRTIVFAYIFAIYSYIQPIGYRRAYPTPLSRLAFAGSFADTNGLRILYGQPRDLLTVSGYSAWRVGGTLAIAAAVFGALAAVRALRAEEDAGRTEIVLAGIIRRRDAYLSAIAAIGLGAAILWLAEFAGFVLARLPAAGSAYLALATASMVPLFAGVGAVASQLAPTRRVALEVVSAAVALFWLLRVIADTARGASWLRWTTPLGWAEEMRPFTGSHSSVLLLPIAGSALLLIAAARLGAGRDIGTGLLPGRDSAEPRLRLLSSTTTHALRSQRDSLIAWTGGVAAIAFLLGGVSKSVSSAGISESLKRQIAKLGSGSIATPTGYLAFVFLLFVLALSLFVCTQIAAAWQEEAAQRLETVLALPVSRTRWLGGRLLLATGAAAMISVASGLFTWFGAASVHVHVSLFRLLEAGANGLPAALLFLGLAALAYAVLPRASTGIAYGIVAGTFLWQTVGSLLSAPRWLVDLTPFAHVSLVPIQPFRAAAAAVMIGIGLAAALAALAAFRQRDLVGA
jgi:ABC-2 type transport system permease protein